MQKIPMGSSQPITVRRGWLERDLLAYHGADYESYLRRVPMPVPGTARRAEVQAELPVDSSV